MNIDTNPLTRVSVIDHTKDGKGLVLEQWNVRVDIMVQDDGRTLKIFMKDRPCPFQTDWRGCNREADHTGPHHDEDSGIDWTGGMIYGNT